MSDLELSERIVWVRSELSSLETNEGVQERITILKTAHAKLLTTQIIRRIYSRARKGD